MKSYRFCRLPGAQMVIALSASLLASAAAGQGHGAHDTGEVQAVEPAELHDHAGIHSSQPAGHEDHNQAMSEMSASAAAGELRDPHAYSGGYTRTEGPYAMPESKQLHLADESILAGVWVDRLESRNGVAEDYVEFSGEAWLGNSYQRWILRSELEWRQQTVEESKTELLYTRAIAPFWNLELGGRYDHGDKEHREWLAVGVSGLTPYWIELSASAYVSPEGHSAATIEAEYDLLLSQRLILQPKVEFDFYGDSDLEAGHGKGLSKSLMGFRLRYDLDRQFSPYVGYERVHRHGETTGVFEPLGQHREEQWIAGFRFWF